MSKQKAVLRHYAGPDADMRQDMHTMREHYLKRAAAFKLFNPEFDDDYGAEWLAAIEAAETAPAHDVRAGELKEQTGAVTTVMEQAQAAVQTLFYYVGRAFPGNAGRLDRYGRRRYAAARDNQETMHALLTTAHAAALLDHAALAEKGYAATQVAALHTLAGQLTTTNTTQETTKGTNTEGTDDYVTLQNLAYGFGQEVSAAAKVLYRDDATTRALFRLGDGGGQPDQPGPAAPKA